MFLKKDSNPIVIPFCSFFCSYCYSLFVLPLSLISTKDSGTASVNSLNTVDQTEPDSLNFCIVFFHPIPVTSLQS